MHPLETLITSLDLNLIVQYVDDEAYIPLGFLYEQDQDTITDIEATAVVTMKTPTLFDVQYGYYHIESNQAIIIDSRIDSSFDDIKTFLKKYIY